MGTSVASYSDTSSLIGQAAGALAPGPGPQTNTWLDHEHPDYQRLKRRWVFCEDMYTAEILDQHKIRTYLIRKVYGESVEAYEERVRLADYPNHFGAIIDSLVGMLSKSEEAATRQWDGDNDVKILGDPADRTSVAGRLWENADGQDTGWITLHTQLATMLAKKHCAWGLVDSVDGAPVLRYFEPECVPDWTVDRHGATSVKLVEQVDDRTDVQEVPQLVTQWIVYDLAGWTRYRKDGHGAPIVKDKGPYEYYTSGGQRCLPIWRIELPMKRFVGWHLAERMHKLFNRKSDRDHLLRLCNHPRLNLWGSEAEVESVIAGLDRGGNAIHNVPENPPAAFISPSPESAKIATDVLDKDVRDIYINAFREYSDSASMRTATEMRQELAAGAGAFLSHVIASLDDAENSALSLITQTLFPGMKNRVKWTTPMVQRSIELMPADPGAELNKLLDRTFGAGAVVPLGAQGRVAAATDMAEYHGLTVSDDEVRAEIEATGILTMLNIAAKVNLPLPAEARVEITLKLLAATGYLDATKTLKLADGTEVKLLDVLRTKMLAQAEAQDAQKALLAQYPPAPGTAGGGAPGGGPPAPKAAPSGVRAGTPSEDGTTSPVKNDSVA